MKDNKQIGIGMLLGTILGILTDNIGLWLSLGIVFGAGMSHRSKKKEDVGKE